MSGIEILPVIQNYIAWYGWPVWLGLGSVGCSLSILLFSRRYFRAISCCLYFLAASVAILLVILLGVIPLIYDSYRPSAYNSISIFCKIRGYMVQSLAMMFRWFMAAASIDRYLHTSENIYLQRLISLRITTTIILIIVIVWIVLPIHQAIWGDILANACMLTNVNIAIYNSFFTIISGGLLPPLIMLVSTLLIQRNLRSKRSRMATMTTRNNQTETTTHSKRDQQALLMLYVQILAYIISNIPWTINLFYLAFTRNVIKSTEELVISRFASSLIEFIWYMYPALSFYLYTLASQTFRQQLIKLFPYGLNYQQDVTTSRRVHPMTSVPTQKN